MMSHGGQRCTQLLLGASLLTACGDPAAVQLVLTPTPEINSTDTLLARVNRLLVVVDAEDGLDNVEAPGERSAGGEALDWDDDGELEVIFSTPLDGDELPVLEIGVAHNTDRELDFTVLGYAEEESSGTPLAAEAIALGGGSDTCPAGEISSVGLPFNLRADQRPPKVVLVLPTDGSERVPGNLAAVTVVFSTTVAGATLADNVSLVDRTENAVAVDLSHRDVAFAGETGQEEMRSVVQLLLSDLPFGLLDGPHYLTIAPGILGRNDLPFDQLPGEDGADGFSSSFEVELIVGGGNPGCLPTCVPGYVCDARLDGCVPEQSCAAGCSDGWVCDPTDDSCVADCRFFGTCVTPGLSCDADSGLCR